MRTLLFSLLLIVIANLSAQQSTSFHRLGSQNEKVQDLFPGSHRARPVVADFTNSGYMGLFYGGQDLGGSTGWYLKEPLDNRWGDLGNGTFANPILNADYSDPDVIRVGEKYYMVASDFHFIGMQVLESEDMVNWKIISQIYSRLDFPKYDKMERYGNGSWAPTIRYHDDKFWVYFCSPEEGLFMSNATNPAGPWLPLVHVKNISGWEDPCPLWDDNGDTYLGRSQLGGGPIIIHKMSADGTQLLDDGVKVYEGPTAEGTKLFKKDGYYYISIPEGGVSTGWQTVMRSQSIYGPYEKKTVLEKGSTKINGPHQGALVDTPEGEWWFYHFQSTSTLGRVVHLQPVTWKDGFPVIGVDYDGNGIGEPVTIYQKPNTGKIIAVSGPQTSDDFSASTLSPQWQFNHNPASEKWSLTKRSGYLTIEALKALKLRDSRNMFTQKMMGFYGEASCELDCSNMENGQRAGLHCVGNQYNAIGVEKKNGKNYIYYESQGTASQIKEITENTVSFKIVLNTYTNQNQFYYSLDGINYVACKEPFKQGESDWKGARVGVYSYNTLAEAGRADFNWFKYDYDGPGKYVPEQTANPIPADWHMWNEMAALVKNNGDGTFSLVQEYDTNIQQSVWTNSVFFDFDNDGNLDLLIAGRGGNWRFPEAQKYVKLYRNLGADGNYLFKEVYNTGFRQFCDEMYFNTISVGDYDHDGYNDVVIMYLDDANKKCVDLYKNNEGTGKFVIQQNAISNPATNGSVMFGDIDNDGWLDILHNGWSTVARGIALHKNNQDGTFRNITPNNISGAWQGQSILSDLNGDGTLDIVVTGHGDNWARYTDVYYNTINPETKAPDFTFASSDQTGIAPINKTTILAADFNNDGRVDMIMNGYDGSKDLTRVYYQNENKKFISDVTKPLFPVNNGGVNMGDINGDGNMDLILAGEKGSDAGDMYSSPVRIYENHPQEAGQPNNQPPTAPEFVNVTYQNNQITITWGESSDDITPKQALRYNIYVKNNDIGKIWMMIPADINTGKLKVGTDLQTSLSSTIKEYTMSLPNTGNYTVGVQALDQAFAGSPFTTYTNSFTGIHNPVMAFRSIQKLDGGILVKSDKQESVDVININGQKIMRGITNQLIPVVVHGIYLLKVSDAVLKIII